MVKMVNKRCKLGETRTSGNENNNAKHGPERIGYI